MKAFLITELVLVSFVVLTIVYYLFKYFLDKVPQTKNIHIRRAMAIVVAVLVVLCIVATIDAIQRKEEIMDALEVTAGQPAKLLFQTNDLSLEPLYIIIGCVYYYIIIFSV